MTIKKPISNKPQVSSAPAGATIADRLRLDAPDPAMVKAAAVNAKATMAAFIAALIALGVAGVLVFVLYQHHEVLMPI